MLKTVRCCAGFEGTHFVEEIFREEEEVFVGDVLAEGDEMHLVVVAVEVCRRGVMKEARVVEGVAGSRGCFGSNADVADDDGRVGFAGE